MTNHEISANSENILKNYKIQIFSLKNCQEKWVVGICNLYKFQSRAQSCEYTGIR
jgi:hypothetical protein